MKDKDRVKKNKIFNEILECYETTIKLNLKGIYFELHEEFRQMFSYELALSIYEYDINKSLFTTYFYLKNRYDIKQRFFRNNRTLFEDKKGIVENWNVNDDTPDNDYLLMDLKLDIKKILTPEEFLIFKMAHKKGVRNVDGVIDTIINKILSYS